MNIIEDDDNIYRSTTFVFIDFEGKHPYLIEVAAVAVLPNREIRTFNFLSSDALSDQDFVRNARFCHCISSSALHRHGIPFVEIQEAFRLFFSQLTETIYVYGYGTDVDLPELKRSFPSIPWECMVLQQVQLPNWVDRDHQLYHEAANRLKRLGHLPGTDLVLSHTSPVHTVFYCCYGDKEKNKAKRRHGYHCAEADCYELAFFTGVLDPLLYR